MNIMAPADHDRAARKRIVIVIPVFNDGASLLLVIEQLGAVFSAQPADISLLIVDDGSVPPLSDLIPGQLRSALRCRMVTLKRNLGHERAIAIGMSAAVHGDLGDIVAVMDADGEDNPADVLRLITALRVQDHVAIAVGVRTERSERILFRIFYQIYRVLFLALTGQRINFGSLSAMPIAAARRLTHMSELWLSLPATILRSRYPIVMIPTKRSPRLEGHSHMNLVALVVLGLSAIAVFVERALTRIILGALAVVAVAALASAAAIGLKLVAMATPGWLTTVLGTSVVVLLATATLCFVGLFLSIISGAHTVPSPSATYDSFIDRVAEFDGKVWSEIDHP